MTSFYVVEEEDSFHADDFGNDDAPAVAVDVKLAAAWLDFDFTDDPDEFFADDFGNDDAVVAKVPSAPTGLTVTLH
jgi:hypothetical protein